MSLTSQKISGVGKFGLAWLVVNAAGWGAGFGIQLFWIHSSGQGGLESLFATLVAAGVIGLAQWLALRWLLTRLRPISQGMAWMILTMFGYIAGVLVGSLVLNLAGPISSPTVMGIVTFITSAIAGLIIGLLQWMALLFFARGAVWWLGANALGYGLGAILRSVVQTQTGNDPLAYGLAGLLVGATTLVALSHFRRPPVS
jgi:hypothetical protein